MKSKDILEDAKANFGITKFVGLFSGGKDSLVACHLVAKLGLLSEVLYCKTGIGLDENIQYVKDTCIKFGWKLNIREPKKQFTYEQFVKRFSFPTAYNHNIIMAWLKWYQIRGFEKQERQEKNEIVGFISGVRSKESKRRFKTHKQPVERPKGDKALCFVKPLFYWSTDQIWDYIKKHALEICPVYKTMHMSGDCICGSYAEPGESKLLTIFHPKTANQILDLELKYGGKWSGGDCLPMKHAIYQQTLDDSLVCYECQN